MDAPTPPGYSNPSADPPLLIPLPSEVFPNFMKAHFQPCWAPDRHVE